MNNQKLFKEVKRLIAAFGYSMDGLRAALGESAFRTEVILCSILIPVALLYGDSAVEKTLLMGSLFLVLIVELLNTAIEKTIDRVSLDIHPLSKKVKDIGSTAVFISVVNAVVIWLLLLWN